MSAHPCEGLARLMHNLLSPCTHAPYCEDHLQDTSEFVRVMDQVRAGTFLSNLGSNHITHTSKAFALDVVSMFVKLPTEKGAQCCAQEWDKFKAEHHPEHSMTGRILKKIILFILANSWFEFDDIVYSILSGTAMGQRHSVGLLMH